MSGLKKMEPYTQRKLNMRNFHFGCNGKDRFDEVQQYLRRLTDADKDSAHHVIIDIAKQQLAVNATVLSALSPYWRNLINENAQDSPVIYKISPVISHGPILLLPLIRLLIYVGNVSVPIKYIKDITTILRELHLEVSDFAVTNTGSEVECLTWENHFGHFMKGLQTMCNKQECTDLSIFVDSHVIKVHKLVLSSYVKCKIFV
ncbi:uncharacterized protein LOC135218084 [Macrobrachium nipponense]|uniref:uncharacterized protein LOC135218084 n=1 Tax=Macrobrachium nipponense TaxID=159736 RepID=UPI0030C7F960